MRGLIFLFLSPLFIINASAQQMPAYHIFNAKGKQVSYKKMLKQLGKSEVVFFGEQHNNPISHWLELEMTKSLDVEDSLILGAEMIEADNQDELDHYLMDSITQKGLDTLARLWSNYKTDYAPLIDYAKNHHLKFIATNIPRRYASLVYHKGFAGLDTLSDLEKTWMAPLPMAFDSSLATYQQILEMGGGHGSMGVVKAQATKDATMAYFIQQNLTEQTIFLHFNGAYHSDFYEGIVWYLRQANPNLAIGTVSTVSQENIDQLDKENLGKADFILCVDADMTSTY